VRTSVAQCHSHQRSVSEPDADANLDLSQNERGQSSANDPVSISPAGS
jgi:hypothetical protein